MNKLLLMCLMNFIHLNSDFQMDYPLFMTPCLILRAADQKDGCKPVVRLIKQRMQPGGFHQS